MDSGLTNFLSLLPFSSQWRQNRNLKCLMADEVVRAIRFINTNYYFREIKKEVPHQGFFCIRMERYLEIKRKDQTLLPYKSIIHLEDAFNTICRINAFIKNELIRYTRDGQLIEIKSELSRNHVFLNHLRDAKKELRDALKKLFWFPNKRFRFENIRLKTVGNFPDLGGDFLHKDWPVS